jgi:hypothetical protein
LSSNYYSPSPIVYDCSACNKYYYCSRTIGEVVLTQTYMSFNYAVTVTTDTDVPGDNATAVPVNVTTHTPGIYTSMTRIVLWVNPYEKHLCLLVQYLPNTVQIIMHVHSIATTATPV